MPTNKSIHYICNIAQKPEIMANTYTQINIQAIYAVKGRENTLSKNIRPRLFEYINGIIKGINCYPLSVNGYVDHVHAFFELNPVISISDALQKIKSNSSKWINEQRFMPGHFQWQSGYAAFSYSRSQRNDVIQYIKNQEAHHRKKSFKEEYTGFLKKFEIPYEDKYLFEFYD